MQNKKTKVLILYSSKYYDDSELNLLGVENAVRQLKKVFQSFANLETIENVPSTDAKKEIENYLHTKFFSEEELFIFYYCGHGFLIDDMQTLLLSTTDTTRKIYSAEVGISSKWLLKEIKKAKKTNYIVVLDCCYSGLISNSMGASSTDIIKFNEAGAAIITSTQKSHQTAKEISIHNKKYAAFTYSFAIELNNLLNESKNFTLGELFNRIKTRISGFESSLNVPIPQMICKDNFVNYIFQMRTQLESIKKSYGIFKAPTKLKVLLVKTCIDYPIKNYDFGVPLGIWLLKSFIQIHGGDFEIDIYDERLKVLKKEEISFEKDIEPYDVVGVSICTCEVPQAIEKLKIAKSMGKKTFVGGIFVSTNEKYLLSHKCIDYAISGVSTLPVYNLFKELLKNKKSGNLNKDSNLISYVKGVATSNNLDSFSVWEPSQLPYIELSVWKEISNNYKDLLNNKIDIFTTRGCNKNCDFCSVQKECGHKVFERDDISIEDEIDFLYKSGFRHFSIKDEDFLMNGSMRLFNILSKSNNKHPDITFKVRARVDEMMNKEKSVGNISLQKLYDIGIREIQYGLETPNKQLLDNINKGYHYSNSELVSFIRKTVNTGIIANCSFILGIQGESKEYYDSLICFFKKLEDCKDKLKIYINFITPHPYKNSFPNSNYKIVSNDLKYYTHKNPVAFPEKMNRMTRKAMIETYEKIVEMFDPEHLYNPIIPNDILNNFIKANGPFQQELPDYQKENRNDI